MDRRDELTDEFEQIDAEIGALEERMQGGDPLSLGESLPASMGLVRRMLTAFGRHHGKEMPATEADLLDVFRAFVKGDPSLNAVRDNVRELVYYRNCLDMDRADALPQAAEKMAVRTARHIYLYLNTRLLQDSRKGTHPLKPMKP